jgi:hypothetical protein
MKLNSINKKKKLETLTIKGRHRGYNNKALLHKYCHARAHKIFGKTQIIKMPFGKF